MYTRYGRIGTYMCIASIKNSIFSIWITYYWWRWRINFGLIHFTHRGIDSLPFQFKRIQLHFSALATDDMIAAPMAHVSVVGIVLDAAGMTWQYSLVNSTIIVCQIDLVQINHFSRWNTNCTYFLEKRNCFSLSLNLPVHCAPLLTHSHTQAFSVCSDRRIDIDCSTFIVCQLCNSIADARSHMVTH